MRYARTIFVTLIAVGAVGAVYVCLTAGLAAYVHMQSAGDGDGGAPAVATTKPATTPARPGGADAAMLAPVTSAGPVAVAPGAVEDVAGLHRRTWTAPRAGLTSPPRYAVEPAAGKPFLVAAPAIAWTPQAAWAAPKKRLLPVEAAAPLRKARPLPEPGGSMPPLALAAPAPITLAAAPAAKVASEDLSVVRVSTVARRRDADRPAVADDPTQQAGERQLLAKPAPVRTTPAPATADRLSIPEPGGPSAGDVRTQVGDVEMPAVAPERPGVVKFKVK